MWWAFGIVTALWLPVIIFFSVISGSMIFCPEEGGWVPSVHRDIDGTFISVEVQRDTIWIREGWLR